MFFTLSQESKENENILFLSSPASFPSAQTLTQWLELPRQVQVVSGVGLGFMCLDVLLTCVPTEVRRTH